MRSIKHQIYYQFENQFRDHTISRRWIQLENHLWIQHHNQLRDHLWNQLENNYEKH